MLFGVSGLLFLFLFLFLYYRIMNHIIMAGQLAATW